MVKLSAKQARFVEEYLVDGNATQAAIRAGYSTRSAHAQGYENLRKPEVAAEVERRRAQLTAKVEINAEWVMRHLAAEATRTGEGTSHSARVSALSSLARCLGMFKEKPADQLDHALAVFLNQMGPSKAPLARRAAG